MRKEKIVELLKINKNIGVPTLIVGTPGIGKTAIVAEFAKNEGLPLVTVIVSQHEATDFSGLMVLTPDGIKFEPPAWGKFLAENPGILFLDEITTASQSRQNAALRLVQERVLGETRLHKGTYTILAANPPEMDSLHELTLPFRNRISIVTMEIDVNDFIVNFPSYWQNPPKIGGIDESRWREIRAKVASFVAANPALLHKMPDDNSNDGISPWASPRSWDYVSRAMSISESITFDIVASYVGESPAYEFINWIENYDLPTGQEILENWDSIEIPSRGDKILTMSISSASAIESESQWQSFWKFAKRLKDSGFLDSAILGIQIAKTKKDRSWQIPDEILEFAEYAEILKG